MSDLTIRQGDQEDIAVAVVNGGLPVDLTGIDLTFEVKATFDREATALISKTTPSEITIADQITNKGEATIAIITTDTVPTGPDAVPLKGIYYWELQGRVAAEDPQTLAGGRIRIKPDLIA